jgi:hypothetical protein
MWPPDGQSPVDNEKIKAETLFIDVPHWVNKRATREPYKIQNATRKETDATSGDRLQSTNTTVGQSYAKLEYFLRVFGSSMTTINGRLRFDIGPGSMIELESARQPSDIGNNNATGESMVGIVDAVGLNYAIQGGSGEVSTSFSIAALRPKSQQESSVNVAPTHPIYNNAWKGTPLMKDFGTVGTPQ